MTLKNKIKMCSRCDGSEVFLDGLCEGCIKEFVSIGIRAVDMYEASASLENTCDHATRYNRLRDDKDEWCGRL